MLFYLGLREDDFPEPSGQLGRGNSLIHMQILEDARFGARMSDNVAGRLIHFSCTTSTTNWRLLNVLTRGRIKWQIRDASAIAVTHIGVHLCARFFFQLLATHRRTFLRSLTIVQRMSNKSDMIVVDFTRICRSGEWSDA